MSSLVFDTIINKAKQLEGDVRPFIGQITAVSPIGCCVVCGSRHMSFDTAYCIRCHALKEVLLSEVPAMGLLPKIKEISHQAHNAEANIEREETEEFKPTICSCCGAERITLILIGQIIIIWIGNMLYGARCELI